jgi:hypothetical protein
MQNQPGKFLPALWGGVLIGVISGVPGLNLINCACCFGVISGGILSAYLYRQSMPPTQTMISGDGAALGLLAGVFGAIIASILDAILGAAAFEMLYRMSDFLDSPELDEVFQRFGPIALARGIFVIGFLFKLVFYCIFGLLGGILGVTFFGKARQQTQEQAPGM